MIVAVTGYIGTGKTTFSNYLAENGFKVINADSIGHALLDDPSIKDRLVNEFGEDILGRDLKIDRKKMSEIVFGDDSKLEILNNLMHDKMIAILRDQVERNKDSNLIIDAALFKKLEIDRLAQKVILMKSDLGNVYTRLQQKYTKMQVINVMDSQEVPVDSDTDIIIENNGGLDDLKRRATEVAMRYSRGN